MVLADSAPSRKPAVAVVALDGGAAVAVRAGTVGGIRGEAAPVPVRLVPAACAAAVVRGGARAGAGPVPVRLAPAAGWVVDVVVVVVVRFSGVGEPRVDCTLALPLGPLRVPEPFGRPGRVPALLAVFAGAAVVFAVAGDAARRLPPGARVGEVVRATVLPEAPRAPAPAPAVVAVLVAALLAFAVVLVALAGVVAAAVLVTVGVLVGASDEAAAATGAADLGKRRRTPSGNGVGLVVDQKGTGMSTVTPSMQKATQNVGLPSMETTAHNTSGFVQRRQDVALT